MARSSSAAQAAVSFGFFSLEALFTALRRRQRMRALLEDRLAFLVTLPARRAQCGVSAGVTVAASHIVTLSRTDHRARAGLGAVALHHTVTTVACAGWQGRGRHEGGGRRRGRRDGGRTPGRDPRSRGGEAHCPST